VRNALAGLSDIRSLVVAVSTGDPGALTGSEEFRYIDIASIDREQKVITNTSLLNIEEAPSRARQLVKAGDVLVSTVRPNLNAVAVVPDDLDGAIASTGFCVLRVEPRLASNRYLFHWVRTSQFVNEMCRLATGASYPAVGDRIILNSQIPAPPAKEQQRIAAVLDKADAIRRKRRQAIGLSDHLIQSVFFELFGDTWTNARGWPTANLEDLCGNIVDCPHSTPVYSDHQTNLCCVRSSDIQQGKIDFGSTLQVSAEVFEERIRRYKPQQGDVIYTREGGRLGNAAQVPPSKDLCLGQRMMLFSAKPLESTNEFIWALLNSPGVRKQVEYLTGGAAAPRINIADIRLFKVVKPPYNVQEKFSRIVAKIREMDVLCVNLNSQLEHLFTSIVGRAFRGEL